MSWHAACLGANNRAGGSYMLEPSQAETWLNEAVAEDLTINTPGATTIAVWEAAHRLAAGGTPADVQAVIVERYKMDPSAAENLVEHLRAMRDGTPPAE